MSTITINFILIIVFLVLMLNDPNTKWPYEQRMIDEMIKMIGKLLEAKYL